jgi:hypothetical protein
VSDQISCPDRERLSTAVAIAIQAVNQAKADADAVIREKRDPISELAAIAAARAVERQAAVALKQHRNEHGC